MSFRDAWCLACRGMTSGDCGMHGPRVIPATQAGPPPKVSTGLAEGRERRAEGLDRVEAHARGWVRMMRDRARTLDRATPGPGVSADDLRSYAGWLDQTLDLRPHHPNAWGAIFNAKGWVRVGETHSRHATNNARRIARWTWKG